MDPLSGIIRWYVGPWSVCTCGSVVIDSCPNLNSGIHADELPHLGAYDTVLPQQQQSFMVTKPHLPRAATHRWVGSYGLWETKGLGGSQDFSEKLFCKKLRIVEGKLSFCYSR